MIGVPLQHIAWALAQHFVLSGCVGLLVYWLTWTILSAMHLAGMEDGRIRTYSLLVALCDSVLVHILQDWYIGRF
jgi:hypothetical protein